MNFVMVAGGPPECEECHAKPGSPVLCQTCLDVRGLWLKYNMKLVPAKYDRSYEKGGDSDPVVKLLKPRGYEGERLAAWTANVAHSRRSFGCDWCEWASHAGGNLMSEGVEKLAERVDELENMLGCWSI